MPYRRCPIHDVTLTVAGMEVHELLHHDGRSLSVAAEPPK